MDVSEFSKEIVKLGFFVKYKDIKNVLIITIWIKVKDENYLAPLGYVYEDKTDFFINYNDAWKSMDFETQKELVYLMKKFSEYKV